MTACRLGKAAPKEEKEEKEENEEKEETIT